MRTWGQRLTFDERTLLCQSMAELHFPIQIITGMQSSSEEEKKWVPCLYNDKIIEQFCQTDHKTSMHHFLPVKEQPSTNIQYSYKLACHCQHQAIPCFEGPVKIA